MVNPNRSANTYMDVNAWGSRTTACLGRQAEAAKPSEMPTLDIDDGDGDGHEGERKDKMTSKSRDQHLTRLGCGGAFGVVGAGRSRAGGEDRRSFLPLACRAHAGLL